MRYFVNIFQQVLLRLQTTKKNKNTPKKRRKSIITQNLFELNNTYQEKHILISKTNMPLCYINNMTVIDNKLEEEIFNLKYCLRIMFL